MIVVVLLVLAVVGFGVGWGTEEELYVQIALGASILAALVVLGRIWSGTTTAGSAAAAGTAGAGDGAGGDDGPADGADDSPATDVPEDDVPADSAADVPEEDVPADSAADVPADDVPEDGVVAPVGAAAGLRDVSGSPDDEVVFLPRQGTFHAPDCGDVLGYPVARGARSDLETTGMTPCARCLPAASA